MNQMGTEGIHGGGGCGETGWIYIIGMIEGSWHVASRDRRCAGGA